MEEKNESKTQEPASVNPGTGVQSSASSLIEQATQQNERLEGNLAALKEESARLQELRAKQILGGTTVAGQAPVAPPKLSDLEYARALKRGEVNPFKEDGLIK